ncbi:hypothetical protein MIMGU_mgv1a025003mg [Erythranthe guttata]|uniref:NB-ARC domain-containing protein n=1 Tax=Erythranthe guttata TaxID=4155 RepID=A0A022Q7E2_ERYGU|nr:hypothetical protein MIMGU_mgv1a025003mg [Erythranthe guttata]
MAYAAVSSLQQTIERLLTSSHISIVQNSGTHAIELLYKEARSLHETLEGFNTKKSIMNMKRVKILEGEIMDAVCEFEDVVESHVLNQFPSQSEQSIAEDEIRSPLLFSVDLQELIREIGSFIKVVNKMNEAYIHELSNPLPEEEHNRVIPSRIDFSGNESKMVGLSNQFIQIKHLFVTNYSLRPRIIVSLYGMAGIGKTTLAKKLFQDPFILGTFERRAFVTIGPKYLLEGLLLDILIQVSPDSEMIIIDGELLSELKRMVFESLKDRRYLIVLDDVWEAKLCCDLVNVFPAGGIRGRVLVTTRLHEVAQIAYKNCEYRLPFLNKKESWDLLRDKVFGEEYPCSYELEKAGKKIAEHCEGLPLTIVTVADILSKADKNPEYLNEVAANKKHSVFVDAYDQMSEVLYPSYDYLDQHFKACFLYAGAFPQNYWIHYNDISNLWSAEGFLDSAEQFRERINYMELAGTFAEASNYYMYELFSSSVLMLDKEEVGCRLHSSFWYLCNKEAAKRRFFYALNGSGDGLAEQGIKIKNQRRLCIRNSILFAMKDVYNSMASVSMVRSLLCSGPYNQYPVPICLEPLRLLRVFHALTIRFYEFPMEVLKLVQVRYLALTYNGNLPASISKLWNLQWLIVYRHLIIIESAKKRSSDMPMEIWDMKELKDLRIMGSNLSHPREESFLPNLLTLYNVNPQSCTKDVFERIPNLMRLGIQIELAPDSVDPLSCFDHVSHLHKLKTLECVIVNPTLKAEIVAPLAPLSDFPSSLTLLILVGLGYPWEEMSKISSLPNLKNLALLCYAFRGPKWEVRDNEFQRLQSLTVKDTDLEQWTFQNYSCLPVTKSLSIAHCYKLKEIPLAFGRFLEQVEVVDCNPLAVRCAEELKDDWDGKYGDERSLDLYVHSSWEDENT